MGRHWDGTGEGRICLFIDQVRFGGVEWVKAIEEAYIWVAWWGILVLPSVSWDVSPSRTTEKIGVSPNLPSGNETSSLNKPPSHIVFSLPGTPHSHFLRSITPLLRAGLAKKPKGWSRRHCLLYNLDRLAGNSLLNRMRDGEMKRLPFLRESVLAERHVDSQGAKGLWTRGL